MIKCHVCKQDTGLVRDEERDIAWITKRAHVDCTGGHSQYRPVTESELRTSDVIWGSRTKTEASDG